jgi:L-lactate dehydrogenase complex protein LldG
VVALGPSLGGEALVSARDDVLAAVRTALGPGRRPDVRVDRSYRTGRSHLAGRDRAGLADLFAERVADYRAVVTRCGPAGIEREVVTALGASARVVVPEGVWLDVPRSVPDRGLTAEDLDAVDAVVTTATLGIAETGTIVLTHGPGQGRRALTLVPDLHVCVVREDQLVPGVVEAVAALDPVSPQTWVSGPSATSDIELSRVEGVHGPRRLHVVLVAG